MSGSTMNLAVTVTANASQLKAEMAAAKDAVGSVGPAAQQTAAQAGAAFNTVGAGARQAGTGMRDMAGGADAAARSTRLTGEQMRQLAPQINDVVTQLALGQSAFMVLASQGGQITQIFGGVGATMRALAGVISPVSWAALGLGSGLLAIGIQAERQERALIATSQRLRATREDYLAMGRAVEETATRISRSTATSTDDARGAALIIGGQRRFGGDAAELERLTRLSADLARVMGTDVPAAAERFVARAISDPARAAREATDGGLRGFDEALVRQARLLVASGDSGAATALVLGRLGDAARGAVGEMTAVQSAWSQLSGDVLRVLSEIREAAAAAILATARTVLGVGRGTARAEGDELGLTQPGTRAPGTPGVYSGPRSLFPPAQERPNDGGLIGRIRTRNAASDAGLSDADAVNESVRRYNSIAGRAPIGSIFRRAPWDAGLAPPSGRIADLDGTAAELPATTVTAADPRPSRAAQDEANGVLSRRGLTANRSFEAALLREEIGTVERGLATATPGSDAAIQYAEALEVLRARLEALKDPIDEANRLGRERAGLFGLQAGAARELATAELEAREAARRAGRDAAGQDAAAAEARGIAQARLNGQLDDAIRAMERERQGILASAAAQQGGTTALREAQIAQEAHTRAQEFGVQGSAAYAQALARITEQLRATKSAQDQVALAPLFQAQRREAGELERRRGLIGASATERAGSDAEAAARERLRATGRPISPELADAYVREERARAENLVGLQLQEAGYQELGRIGETAFDNITRAMTQAGANGQSIFKSLRNAGNAAASELTSAFLRLALINPLKNAAGLGGGNATTLGDLIGGAGRLFGGGETFKGLPVVSSFTLAHSGGIMGLETPGWRLANPAIFANAPRFHGGGMPGLASDEVPAILQRGEGVFTPEQMRALSPAGGRGDVIFNIQFQGDAGSATDRNALIEGLRGMVRQEIGAAAPGIVNASASHVADMARRGGAFSRDVGRRA